MSALHTIIAAARQHSPTAPARPRLLPRDTRFDDRDIHVDGHSLRELSQERTTPCVLIAPVEGTGRDRFVSVVVTTVTRREEPGLVSRTVHLAVDSHLAPIAAQVTFVVLLNGARDRRLVSSVLVDSGPSRRHVPALLPAITSPGDKLVLFCEGTVAHSQLTSHIPAAPSGSEELGDGWTGRRGK